MSVIHPLRIGNVKLQNNIILAPMAGVCDLPFRVLCSSFGVGMTCTEMVSAKAIFYNNKKTYKLMERDDREPVVAVQLFGHEPVCISEMAARLEDEGIEYDILDINMGCPVPKVVNNEDGSALMKNPSLAGRIIEETVKATARPVTAKIRIGFDDKHINAVEMAHVLEESGVSAIAVHGRTREQYYSGKANWDVIGEVKSRVNVPVIGNGDLTCYNDILKMNEQTGVDGYMIGRAAQGNPWIFEGILRENELLEGYEKSHDNKRNYSDISNELSLISDGNKYKPDWDSIRDMIIKHAKMLIDYKGEYIGIREMRKHAAWYTAGLHGASAFRGKINEVESIDELKELLY